MKDRIIEIVENNPKRYSQIIRGNPELMAWVEKNMLVSSEVSIAEKVYSAINQTDGVCPIGNKKSFITITQGYGYCGHASVCKCNKELSAAKQSKTRAVLTEEQKQQTEDARVKTMNERYGHSYNTQRPEVKEVLKKPKVSPEVFEKLSNYEWLNEEYNTKKRSLVDIAEELGVYYGTVGEYCSKFNFYIRQRAAYSMVEIQIKEYIESLGLEVEHGNWTVFGDREIDLYIPSKKLGIEVNGLFWHSYNPNRGPTNEDVNRHLHKTTRANELGVNLLHITDYEWSHKQEKIKSLIATKCGIFKQMIYARKCDIREVSKTEEKAFVDENHLQGYVPSSTALGLYHDNELVSLMSIGKSRFDKTSGYELLRFCTKLHTGVVGGAEKLMAGIKKIVGNDRVTSYCDLSKFTGNVYEKLGFQKIDTPTPSYFWTDGDNIVISRFKCQKKQLQIWLTSFDPLKSEAENMFAAGYRRFWDCGQQKYVLN
jgi:hypothetical protein